MANSLANARKTFDKKAKTFSFAARLLPKQRHNAVVRLYAFCRYMDDLADAEPAGCNSEALQQIRAEIVQGSSRNEIISDTLLIQSEFGIPLSLLLDFTDALIEDQYPRELQTQDELVRFGYGVASTVGLMLCHIFGIKNPQAFPFAVDLGVAMQLTNIARDTLEDAERGRIYIPKQLMSKQITCDGLLSGAEDERMTAFEGVGAILSLADEYYASASQGFGYLPRGVRHSIKLAARLYQAIGDKILEHPEQYWSRRTVVSRAGKCHIFLNMLIIRLRNGYCQSSRIDNCHRQHLHRALDQRRFSA
ncbi:MAG TPA: hypothetical protein DDZ38_00770 [Gammaproteobacteria bacterium]|nr:hypothetical protein [Gammaproteobacteria bacterium]|tara:strand:+ start:5927 stop:6844 length:918 start_codon:yes stop_codon:yes gene_type:complete